MSTAPQPGRQRPPPVATRPKGESPKRFFQVLREQQCYVHKLLGKWLTQAGFQVKTIRRMDVHPVWEVRLGRGCVAQGYEVRAAFETICAVLSDHAVKHPEREVDVYARDERVQALFIFDQGTAGTLAVSGDNEKWFPEASQPYLESEE
jgi:hypothetical protein